jgi:hypothetical protein
LAIVCAVLGVLPVFGPVQVAVHPLWFASDSDAPEGNVAVPVLAYSVLAIRDHRD